MKKKIIIFTSFFILCIILCTLIFSNLKSGNKSSDYEYYYNDDSLAKGNKNMADFDNNIDDMPLHIPKSSDEIDTDPTSITVFINQEYSLPTEYVPSDLIVPDIPFDITYFSEKKLLRSCAASALEKLFSAAKSDNISLCGVSGYRSYNRQQEIYKSNLSSKGVTYTNRYSAKPGFSEHQSGLSIDVSASSINNRLDEDFETTTEGKWLAENAHRFGFIIRYPKNKEDITGYSYEPWHIRYVGINLAKYIYKNNLTLDEFYHYVLSDEIKYSTSNDSIVDVDVPIPTATPDSSELEVSPTPLPSKLPNTNIDTSLTKESPLPTKKPISTKKPSPTKKPVSTKVPIPTKKPLPTKEPSPTKKPFPTKEPIPTDIPDSDDDVDLPTDENIDDNILPEDN